MALPPDVGAAELEQFLAAAEHGSLGVTPQEADALRLLHGRQAEGGAEGAEDGDEGEGGPEADAALKVVVLGDEQTSGKIGLMQLLALDPSARADPAAAALPFDIRRVELGAAEPGAVGRAAALELWAPGCGPEHASLRPLLLPGAACVVLVFSITQPLDLRGALEEVRAFQQAARHEVPVLLVGNHAEERQAPSRAPLVPPQEAIELATAWGLLKYVEVQSYNPSHAHEIFRQAALAVQAAREGDPEGAAAAASERRREARVARRVLCAPRPEGRFNPWTKDFEVVGAGPGVEHLVSCDGAYVDVFAVERCKYRSHRRFAVPREAAPPRAHFDPAANRLVTDDADGGCICHYTLDNSEPTSASPAVGPRGVALDGQPRVIKLVAVREGQLRSPTAVFTSPNVLPPPKCAVADDGQLTIDTPPGVVVRCEGATPPHCCASAAARDLVVRAQTRWTARRRRTATGTSTRRAEEPLTSARAAIRSAPARSRPLCCPQRLLRSMSAGEGECMYVLVPQAPSHCGRAVVVPAGRAVAKPGFAIFLPLLLSPSPPPSALLLLRPRRTPPRSRVPPA